MRILVNGCAGRMGRTLLRLIDAQPGCELAGGLEPEGSPLVGDDLGPMLGKRDIGVRVTDDPLEAIRQADAIVDFSAPQASVEISTLAAQARCVHIIGTTGFSAEQDAAITAAARHARIVKSGNMSLGVNLIAGLVRQAAAALGADWDIEITEMHHRHKVDAPSGTALMLGAAAATGRRGDAQDLKLPARDGLGDARPAGGIGYAALRGGSVVGDHEVIFAGESEQIRLTHRAESRDIFARGAIQAAIWARDKAAGLYTMEDVLGLNGSA